MPSDVIRCSLCGQRKLLDEFSKQARKNREPSCKRCVAWTETQEPSVLPAPLATGHQSFEEAGPGYWGDEYRMAEDYFQPEGPSTPAEPEPETEPTPTPSIAGSSSVTGLPTHLRSKVAKRVPPPSASSATGTPSTASLPPHLRRRVEQQQKERLAAATATATGTGTGTNSGAGSGTVTPDGVAASLAAASLASTSSQDGSDTAVPDTAAIPNAPRQETNNNVKPFNKQWFDAYGNLTEAPGRNSPGFRTGAVLPPASPAASLDIVDEERTARAKLAQAKVGQAAAATPEQSPKPKGNWPRRVPREPKPARQLDTDPDPHYPLVREGEATSSQRRLGFCPDDSD